MFNDHYCLTRAVLNGRKTMTRRVEKKLERLIVDYEKSYGQHFEISFQKWDKITSSVYVITPHGLWLVDTNYKLGEVVAVAQAYRDFLLFNHPVIENGILTTAGITKGWKNKEFVRSDLMPYQTEIKGVQIKRIQDITDEECLKEGIEYSIYFKKWFYTNNKNTEFYSLSPRKAFASLINRPGVGRKGIWEKNPFVVEYEFCVKERGLV